MHIAVLWLVSLASTLSSQEPEYVSDPFGDGDFKEAPLILSVAFPHTNRMELSVMFSASAFDKYSNHLGTMLELDYGLTDTVGVAGALGFVHGSLTGVVIGETGIVSNRMKECADGNGPCGDITPKLADYAQITGFVDAMAYWAPLYGKVNVVSEIDAAMQLFLMGGLGVHGRRTIQVHSASGGDYSLSGSGFLEGGFLSNAEMHATVGAGVRVFVHERIALRADLRGMLFPDEYKPEPSIVGEGESTTVVEKSEDAYLAHFWFMHVGVSIALF